MDKKTRFKPASFLEIDDLYGGRKTVMVGADGITYWDALNVDTVTPVVIHPIFNPREVGPLIEFARKQDLLDSLRALTAHINEEQDGRAQRDVLFVMRSLIAYSKGVCDGSASAFRAAVAAAEQEEARAMGMQSLVERYTAAKNQDTGSSS